MATAWPSSYPRTHYAASKSSRQGRLAALAARQAVIAREAPFSLADDDVLTTTSATWAALRSWSVLLPAYAVGKNLITHWWGTVDLGSADIKVAVGANEAVLGVAQGALRWLGPLSVPMPSSVQVITITLSGRLLLGAGPVRVDHTGYPVSAWFED